MTRAAAHTTIYNVNRCTCYRTSISVV